MRSCAVEVLELDDLEPVDDVDVRVRPLGGAAEGELERVAGRGDVDRADRAHRFSGVAKRARNSAAASRIAAGRSPRGQVSFASSNSWNGLQPDLLDLDLGNLDDGHRAPSSYGRWSRPNCYRRRSLVPPVSRSPSDPPYGLIGASLVPIAAALATSVAARRARVRAQAPGATHRLLPDLVTLRMSQDDLVLEPSEREAPPAAHEPRSETGAAARSRSTRAPSSNDCDGDGNPANDRDVVPADLPGLERRPASSTASSDTESDDFLFGCERYHPAAPPLARARLRPLRAACAQQSGRTVARSTKIGFCIVDTDHRFAGLPGSPARPYYPAGSADCDRDSIDGLSVGWADDLLLLAARPGARRDRAATRPLLPGLHRRSGQPAAGVRQLEQHPPGPDRAAPGQAHGRAAARPLPRAGGCS